jgi:hypothetical protein
LLFQPRQQADGQPFRFNAAPSGGLHNPTEPTANQSPPAFADVPAQMPCQLVDFVGAGPGTNDAHVMKFFHTDCSMLTIEFTTCYVVPLTRDRVFLIFPGIPFCLAFGITCPLRTFKEEGPGSTQRGFRVV